MDTFLSSSPLPLLLFRQEIQVPMDVSHCLIGILSFAFECEASFSLPKLSQFEIMLKSFVAALNMSHSHIAKFILKRFQINFAVVDVFAHKKTTLAMAQGSLKHKQDVGVERFLQHEMFGLGYFTAFLVFLLFKKTQACDCGNLGICMKESSWKRLAWQVQLAALILGAAHFVQCAKVPWPLNDEFFIEMWETTYFLLSRSSLSGLDFLFGKTSFVSGIGKLSFDSLYQQVV